MKKGAESAPSPSIYDFLQPSGYGNDSSCNALSAQSSNAKASNVVTGGTPVNTDHTK